MANTDVTWKHPGYVAREEQLELVNTIYAGVDTARSLITMLRNESETSYDTRVTECTLDNFVERITTTMAAGMSSGWLRTILTPTRTQLTGWSMPRTARR